MEKPTRSRVRRALNWVLVPLCYPEYRNLMARSMLLSLRLELLCTLFAVVSPFATPGLLRLLERWFEALHADVTTFSRLLRARRSMLAAQFPAPLPAPVTTLGGGEFRNPWA